MKYLTLMRHAKSSWPTDDQEDKARTLNERGNRDAAMMSRRLFQRVGAPDNILCSSSQRTRETADYVLTHCKVAKHNIFYTDNLYLASPGEMLKQIEQCSNDINHLMVIAHNPGTEMLGRMLHAGSPNALPTCAMLHFSIESDSFKLGSHHKVNLLLHDFPKNSALA